jgi:hypothetical protein
MNSITAFRYDRNYQWTFHCKNYSGDIYVFDAGNTIGLRVWEPGHSDSVVLSGACTIANVTSGTCTYTLSSGAFCSAEYYLAKLEFTRSGNIVESLGPFQVKVLDNP